VLYLGRHQCGLKLRELGEAVGLDYVSVGTAVKRFERRLTQDKALAKQVQAASQHAK